MNVTEAAGLGSDFGAGLLGSYYYNGSYGLPKDPARARYWLKKLVDGECKFKYLADSAKADAAEWLRKLDE